MRENFPYSMQRFVVLFIFVFPFFNCVNEFIWFGESVSSFFCPFVSLIIFWWNGCLKIIMKSWKLYYRNNRTLYAINEGKNDHSIWSFEWVIWEQLFTNRQSLLHSLFIFFFHHWIYEIMNFISWQFKREFVQYSECGWSGFARGTGSGSLSFIH